MKEEKIEERKDKTDKKDKKKKGPEEENKGEQEDNLRTDTTFYEKPNKPAKKGKKIQDLDNEPEVEDF